jgi:hypothetical protein
MAIHVSKRVSGEGWITFETDPYLTQSKKRVYQRCLPCLEGLLSQLKSGKPEIALGPAWSCWKVTAVFPDMEHCWSFLLRFEELFPQEYVCGKLGTSDPRRPTRVVVFHLDGLDLAEKLLPKVKEAAAATGGAPEVKLSRGCADPYEHLLGPWPEWQAVSPLRYPERVPATLARLQVLLYGQPPAT